MFDPETRRKVGPGEYHLLICDGHDSHITGEFIAYCIDNNILLMILPPHSSHLTQPLDVGVFGVLKKVMASKLEPLLRTGVSRIQKVEWTGAFVKAYEEAFRAQNIIGGFHGTGIHPYVPSKVLPQVSDPTPPRPSTPPSPITSPAPFNEVVLMSSPPDI